MILLFQVLKLSRLPQTLTLHLMRFSIKNLRTEKVCHSLYFPQSLDLNPLLETEEEPCAAEGQVSASRPLPTRPMGRHNLRVAPSPELPTVPLTRGDFWASFSTLGRHIQAGMCVAERGTQREENSPVA